MENDGHNKRRLTRKEHIYVIQEREFIRLNEKTLKIGKTGAGYDSDGILKRLKHYPKGSTTHAVFEVNDCTIAERELMKKLITHPECIQMRTYGNEYFNVDDTEKFIETVRKIIEDTEGHNLLQHSTRNNEVYLDYNGVYLDYIEDHIIETENESDVITFRELYDDFRRWHIDMHNEKPAAWSRSLLKGCIERTYGKSPQLTFKSENDNDIDL